MVSCVQHYRHSEILIFLLVILLESSSRKNASYYLGTHAVTQQALGVLFCVVHVAFLRDRLTRTECR